MSAEGRPRLLALDRLRCAVEAVREALEAVEAERRAVVVAAVRAGMSKRSVALAAGVTRQTLDRWLGVWQRTS